MSALTTMENLPMFIIFVIYDIHIGTMVYTISTYIHLHSFNVSITFTVFFKYLDANIFGF